MIGVESRLREGVKALRCHHAGDRPEGAADIAELCEEERRPQEADLRV